jgi:hypothetical protein
MARSFVTRVRSRALELITFSQFRVAGHYATLNQLFKEPPPPVRWGDVKRLLAFCEVRVLPGPGNGTRLELNGVRTEVHTPEDNVPHGTIRKTRDFLENIGASPSHIWAFLARGSS